MSDASAPATCPTITIRLPPEVKALFSDLAANTACPSPCWRCAVSDGYSTAPTDFHPARTRDGPATDRITIRLRPGDGRGIPFGPAVGP